MLASLTSATVTPHSTARRGQARSPAAVPINHAPAPPRILWSEARTPGELVVQIRSTDRAGLLARLTAVFERDGVDIAWAKVTTLGSSVVDLFGIVGHAAAAGGDGAGVRDELEHDLLRGAAHPAAREAGAGGQLGWLACLNPCPTG